MAWYDTRGTTDIKGAAFGNPTQAEAAAAGQVAAAREHAAAQIRGQALIAGAHEDQSLRAGADPAIKGSGTLTHYRPTGGWPGGVPAGGEGTGSVKGANLVGGLEPTAYNAGAGAPAPIGVIRGTRQTFATDTGGPQLQEFATPLQAGQASNRFEKGKNLVAIENLPVEAQPGAREAVEGKFGGYRAPGQTLAEIQATKEPPSHGELWRKQGLVEDEKLAGLKRENAAQARSAAGVNFDKYYKSMFGGSVPKENEAAHADYADARAWEQDHPGEGKNRYHENIQVRQFEPLFNQAALDAHKLGFNAQELSDLKQQSPEHYRQVILKFAPQLQQSSRAAAPSPDQRYETPGF